MRVYRAGPETERLILRALTVKDADAFYALNSNPEVMRFTHEPLLNTVDEARQALADYPDFDTVGYGRWGCVLKMEQRVIGFCGLKYLDELEEVDVGYRLLPEYWGRGLATEACLATVRFGFEVLELPRIIGLVLPANIASIRVLQKIGMSFDGEILYDRLQVLRFSIENKRS